VCHCWLASSVFTVFYTALLDKPAVAHLILLEAQIIFRRNRMDRIILSLIIGFYSAIPLLGQTQGSREYSAPLEEDQKTQNRAGQGGAELGAQLKGELGAAAEKEELNPLLNIAQSMMEVHRRMSQNDAGAATLTIEKQIIADLDRLIDEARKSAGQKALNNAIRQTPASDRNIPPNSQPDANEAQKPGKQPAAQSSPLAPGNQARKSDLQDTQARMKKLWGELPADVRRQMLQMPVEQFVPKYEGLIEDYFRNLSDEKMKDESGTQSAE
jgi:hypothetical protein